MAKIKLEIPDWVYETEDDYLASCAEDAYWEKAYADAFPPANRERYEKGLQHLARLNDPTLPRNVRCEEGDLAADEFIEARE